ncbi:hypothetical protein EN868_11160 [Mesorhizobium sp. M2D.F.Ca.ET.225.01.1.1]|uniref:hypothetical protein n=1 Tax=unclassified Mesorhizobium TaxID=325217 RepID=UPI000FD2BDA2|nr:MULTISPECIES: hypothetical protein [unclassified Mesorhizobium]TGP59543.1 hypothetical protein EN869_014830 [Mesorhizobium sp. M2D.F.Ca.ET.226.01.1.1]TGP69178.1 hypothetical protein EN868_11160 [Mesorhizobium sp. M2D.F.Ca.ET.225.01.1.1]
MLASPPISFPELPPVIAGLGPIWTILADLTPQQVEFLARYYANGRNASEAARHAGYAAAKTAGYALLHRRAKVAAAVKRIDRILAHRFQNAFALSMGGDPRGSAVMSEVYPLLPQDMRP